MAASKAAEPAEENIPGPDSNAGIKPLEKSKVAFQAKDAHPSGRESHGRLMQILRGFAFAVYFFTCILAYVLSFHTRTTKQELATDPEPGYSLRNWLAVRCTSSTRTGTMPTWL